MLSLVLLLSSALVLTGIFVDQSSPNCLAANGSQAAPFCTIQQALGVAASGDTIRVAPGRVRGALDVAGSQRGARRARGRGRDDRRWQRRRQRGGDPRGTTATIDGVTLSNKAAMVGAGVFSFDWNAFRAANPAALGAPFALGDIVYAQGWRRDPPTSKGTGFSNALQFVVDP